jgi:hypothetical protein
MMFEKNQNKDHRNDDGHMNFLCARIPGTGGTRWRYRIRTNLGLYLGVAETSLHQLEKLGAEMS